jgi:post-segregation antitoxin (ccd killing protein)
MSDVNEFNAETGEVVIRPYTSSELIQRAKDCSTDIDKEVVTNPGNEALESAIDKLKTIGLTEEEAKAIAGI